MTYRTGLIRKKGKTRRYFWHEIASHPDDAKRTGRATWNMPAKRLHHYRPGDIVDTRSGRGPARVLFRTHDSSTSYGQGSPTYWVETSRGVRDTWNEDMGMFLVRRRPKRYARDSSLAAAQRHAEALDANARRYARDRHHHRSASAPSFAKQRQISTKIRLLRAEGYGAKQAAAIAYRMAGIPARTKAERRGSSRDAKKRERYAIRKVGHGWQVYSLDSSWKSSRVWATYDRALKELHA